MKNTIIAVVVIIIVVAIAWYGWGNKDKDDGLIEGAPVKVGVIGPMTGDAAIYGEPNANIIKMAADEINAQGGIDGHQIELIIEDGKCSGSDAVSAAQKLINVDKVQVIIGGLCSGESLAIVPVAEKAKVSLLSIGSSSPDLTDVSKFFVRNYPSDNTQGVVLATAAVAKGITSIGFIQEQTDYALGVYKAFSAEFEKNGGKITKEEYSSETSDFRSQLSKLNVASPTALFISAQTPASAQRIMKQIQDINWKPQLFLSDVIADPQTLATYKDLVEGAYGAQFGENKDDPKFQALVTNYKAKYGVDVPYPSYAQTEYDGLYMIADAIKDVGYNGEKIAKWLRDVKDWQGASGSVTIGSDGDRDGGHILRVVRDGQFVNAE